MKSILLTISLFLFFSINAQITVYPYVEDFEAGDGGWTVTGGLWELGTPSGAVINSAAGGVNSWATNLTGLYPNSSNAWVTSPVFDFTAVPNPLMQAAIWWNSEFSWDGTVLQSSINGGTTWQNVGALGDPGNWYTDGTISGNPGGQQVGWSGRNSSGNGSLSWVNASHDLTGLGGQANVILRFAFGSDGSVQDDGFAFDNINIVNLTCPAPTGLTATNILSTTVDLNWAAIGNAVDYDVEWGVPGFVPGTGTAIGSSTNVTGLTTNVTGLTPITTYQFYVMTDCGALDGISLWAGPFSFVTSCAIFTSPWTDDIEAHTPATNVTASNCWTATPATGFNWNITGLGTTPSTGTGALSANSGNNYFYTEASSGFTGDEAILTSPNVDVTALTLPMISFYYHMKGAQMGSVNVEAWDGAAWNIVDVITGEQQALQSDPWLLRAISLPGYTGIIQFRFRATSNGNFEGDICLDDISIIETPTCPQPSNLILVSDDISSAIIAWTNGGSEIEWELEYGPIGFVPGTGTSVNSNTNPTTISGLASDQFYDVYVRAVCTPGDSSFYSGPINFNTSDQASYMVWNSACPAIGFIDISGTGTDALLTDDSEFGVTMPFQILYQGILVQDITIGNNGGVALGTLTGNIGYGGNMNTLPDGLYPWGDDLDSETGNVYFETIGVAPNRIFIVHWENICNFSGAVGNPTVNFQLQIEEATNEIYYVYDDVIFGGTDVLDDYAANADIGLAGPNQDITVSANDSVFLTNNSCVHFYYTACPSPVEYTVIYTTNDEAGISWSAGLSGETDWTVIYGPQGFDPLTSGTLITTTITSIIIPGLNQITTYDIYIYADCNPGVLQSDEAFGQFITLPNCSDVTNISANTNVDSLFSAWSWVESSGVGTYPSSGFNIQYGVAGFPLYSGTVVNADNNFTDTTFDATFGSSITYDVYIQAVCGSDTSNYVGPITFTTPLTNDFPCFAEPLNVDGIPLTFDGSLATVSVGEEIIAPEALGCMSSFGWCDTIISFSSWFTFIAPTSGIVNVSGIDADFDGQMAVYEVGDCNDYNTFTLLAANDDATDGSSLAPDFIVCGLIAGNTYYLMHDARSIVSNGNYSIKLDSLPGLSYAGSDNTLLSCLNAFINLNDALDSNVPQGGDWYGPFGNIIPGGFDQSGNLPGFYNYLYIATSDDCPSDSANVLLEVDPNCDNIGIEEMELDNITIFPNPSSKSLYIHNEGIIDNYTIQLYDLQGKTLSSSTSVNISTSDYQMDLSRLKTGVYLLKISNDNAYKVFRVIKE